MALRVREIGRKRIQTLKVPNGGALGLQSFRELEAELPSDMPSLAKISDRTLARELREEVWPRLQPVFLTNFERTSWTLPYRASEIEVSWDRGSIRAGDREEAIHELEIELKGGDRVDLWGAAEELLDILPFRLGHATKAARGYALADASTAQPQKATPVKLSDEDTVAVAFEKIVTNCIMQMQANEVAMLATGAVEAIHQFRVALRRLRAIVGAYRELIDEPSTPPGRSTCAGPSARAARPATWMCWCWRHCRRCRRTCRRTSPSSASCRWRTRSVLPRGATRSRR